MRLVLTQRMWQSDPIAVWDKRIIDLIAFTFAVWKAEPPRIGVGVSANSPNTGQTGLLEEVPGMLAEQTQR